MKTGAIMRESFCEEEQVRVLCSEVVIFRSHAPDPRRRCVVPLDLGSSET
jgi:hypothetical protein